MVHCKFLGKYETLTFSHILGYLFSVIKTKKTTILTINQSIGSAINEPTARNNHKINCNYRQIHNRYRDCFSPVYFGKSHQRASSLTLSFLMSAADWSNELSNLEISLRHNSNNVSLVAMIFYSQSFPCSFWNMASPVDCSIAVYLHK